MRKLPVLIQRINFLFTGCDLPPQVEIGKRVRFQHYGMGVVVHMRVTIGDDVVIMPHVVLGQNLHDGVPVAMHRITIGDGVLIGAGAKIIATGRLEIGKGAAIGANAVVLSSVPPGMLAVGVPAKYVPRRQFGAVSKNPEIPAIEPTQIHGDEERK